MTTRFSIIAAAAALAAGLSGVSTAQSTFTEDFTGGSTTNNWYYFNGACLTAGTISGGSSPGKVPSCISIENSYYAQAQDHDAALVGGKNGVAGNTQTLPDPLTPTPSGALRFTNGSPYGHGENGAIVSSTAFNAGQGIQITFKTVTYRGDSGGAGKDGADGMSFYLIDGSQNPGNGTWNGIGSWGGSLGYTCSNSNPPYDGLVGAYLGLGIDEFGNFLNGTSLVAGYAGTNVASGDNTALGYGYFPGRIGLRGAGSVSWAWLNTTYPNDYPTSTLTTTALQQAAVQKTCSTGVVWNYAASATNPIAVANPSPALQDYAPIIGTSYSELPSTGAGAVVLANESAMARPDGTTTAGVTNGNVFLYNLQITQNGLLSFSYSVNGGAYTNVINGQSISASNGALPATLRFGFAGSTGGDTNIHEILCFKAAPSTVSSTSGTVNEKQTSELQTTSQAYFAFYNPNDWTGRVTAYGLSLSAVTGQLSIANNATWDAECVLTGILAGQTCLYTGSTTPVAAEGISGGTGRQILTVNGLDTAAAPGIVGTPFEWGNLTGAEQTALGSTKRLNYLRGDRTNEINSAGLGLYRARDGVLGDIVDSSPSWVGPPSAPYLLTWKDRFVAADTMSENSGQSYSAFQTTNQGRLNVIYAGVNDGFLHGFRTGSEGVAGNVISSGSTPNDGSEVLAYMPGAVLNAIHSTTASLDFSNPQYAHNFFVDAPPGTGDLYYANAWHTWLVGGLGAGGSAIYALDITNPTNFLESNAQSLVIGEWGSGTITCTYSTVTTCANSLGKTYGTPQIRRFHNGMWGAVFGNGYGSANGDAGIFVMLVGQPTGSSPPPVTFVYMSAGKSPGNGIAYVTPADLDGDHITDFVYAGDLQGNVWRFDVTNANPQFWAVTSPGPLFKATSATGVAQPITTPVVVASAMVAGTTPQVIVAFGTGQRTQFTTTSATSYVSGTQSIYGVWDWNFSTPNPGSTNAWNTTAVAKYASLTSIGSTNQIGNSTTPKLAAPYTLSRANLQAQIYTLNAAVGANPATITTTDTTLNWELCGASCNAGVFGWYVDLPGGSGTATSSGIPIVEQIVSTPSVFEDALLVNSTIPANNQPLNCNSPTTDGGVTYAIALVSGGVFAPGGASPTSSTTSFTSAFVNYKDTPTVGVQTNETGGLSVVNTATAETFIIGQYISVQPGQAPGGVQQIALTNTAVNRLTWVEMR